MDYLQYYLINIDIQTFADAIHGGPPPTPQALLHILQQHGVAMPASVLASYSGPQQPALLAALQRNHIAYLDQIHPLMLYVFPSPKQIAQSQAILEAFHFLHGEDFELHTENLLSPIQQAIVSLRNTDLARHQRLGSEPDRAAEISARDQALQALRLNGDISASQFWVQLTLYKHRGRLVSARRRLIEFISHLCADLECTTVLDHIFKRCINTVQNTYAFPALEEQFLSCLEECIPFCFRGHGHQSSLVRQALQFIESHHQEAIGLSDIANELHISSAHLSRKVKQETGENVTDILHRLRLSNAKHRLSESDDGILSIALDCGFPSVEHFHRIFKRHTGVTPKQWRREHSL